MRLMLNVAVIVGGLLGAADSSFAQTWTKFLTLPNTNWYSVASSSDGSKLVAAPVNTAGKFYVSTNAGVSWITNNSSGLVQPVTSADGTRWSSMRANTGLYVSTNSGILWQATGTLTGYDNFGNTAMSADGSTIAVAPLLIGTHQWSSVNAPSGGMIALPENGSKWIIANTHATQSANIYTSTNMGASWTTNSLPSTNVTAFASSADGNKIIACEYYTTGSPTYAPGNIYISTNSGLSWLKTLAPSNSWTGVASSADGSKLVAVANSALTLVPLHVGGIYTSIDGGNSWVSNSAPITNWVSVTSSADGNKLVAAVSGGGIYTAYYPPSPQISALPSATNVTLFWITPSTNFVLQQSVDLTTWSVVTNAPVLNFTNLQYQVSLTPSNSSAFFRLSTP